MCAPGYEGNDIYLDEEEALDHFIDRLRALNRIKVVMGELK